MSALNVVAPVVLSAMTVLGALSAKPEFLDRVPGNRHWSTDSTDSVKAVEKTADSIKKAEPDTFTPPMLGQSLRYGVDTTVSPCVDFYQYVNGDWRAKTKLGKVPEGQTKRVEIFSDTYRRTRLRLQAILDSARAIAATLDPAGFRLGRGLGQGLGWPFEFRHEIGMGEIGLDVGNDPPALRRPEVVEDHHGAGRRLPGVRPVPVGSLKAADHGVAAESDLPVVDLWHADHASRKQSSRQ